MKMIEKEVIKCYKKAGEISKKAKEIAKKIVKPGVKYIDIYEELKKVIEKENGNLAFPINISENEVAAHDSAYVNDKRKIKEESIVKIDIGVEVNGYIADTAITINFNDTFKNLVKVNKELLKEIEKNLYYGMKVKEIGEIAESFMKEFSNYKIVRNLSGHSLDRYNLHSGLTISNIKNSCEFELKEIAIAIEPFLTLGSGIVEEGRESPIYMLISEKLPRSPVERKIIEFIKDKFKTLPFSELEIYRKFKSTVYLKNLVRSNILYNFRILKDTNIVSQFEHTYLFVNGKVIRTT